MPGVLWSVLACAAVHMRFKSYSVLLFICLSGILLAADDRAGLFRVPDLKELPADVEVVSTDTVDGVVLKEICFRGAPFNGKPTRIYGFYARPAGDKHVPAVVQLRGAGLTKLDSKAAIYYARNGFACLSLDWAGPAKDRKEPRVPPFSEFDSPGNIAKEIEAGKPWECPRPERDGISQWCAVRLAGVFSSCRIKRKWIPRSYFSRAYPRARIFRC